MGLILSAEVSIVFSNASTKGEAPDGSIARLQLDSFALARALSAFVPLLQQIEKLAALVARNPRFCTDKSVAFVFAQLPLNKAPLVSG